MDNLPNLDRDMTPVHQEMYFCFMLCFWATCFCFSPTEMLKWNSLWHGHFTTKLSTTNLTPLISLSFWHGDFPTKKHPWKNFKATNPLAMASCCADSGAQTWTIGRGRAGIGIRRPGWISRFTFRCYMLSSWNDVPGLSWCFCRRCIYVIYIDIILGVAAMCPVHQHGITCITYTFQLRSRRSSVPNHQSVPSSGALPQHRKFDVCFTSKRFIHNAIMGASTAETATCWQW